MAPDAAPDIVRDPSVLLHLDGFDGPMDLLLDLARGQKVDLARISILSLVEQYLAIVDGARRVRLELAADWLVMAAWLTLLKSRLLLPSGAEDPADSASTGDDLARRLHELEAARAAAAWLADRPQLGVDVFPRGAPECLTELDRSRLAADLPGLLRAYLAALRRASGRRRYRPARLALWTMQDALARLQAALGSHSGWFRLEAAIPAVTTPLAHRAALASTLLAGLEMARSGAADIRQDQPFGAILLRAGS